MAVYFITAREIGRVKIGYAADAWRRFNKIQSDSPCEVDLEATVVGSVEDERAFHARFAAHRIRREWFALCPEIEDLIAANRFDRPVRAMWLSRREADEGSVEALVQKFGNASEMARKLNIPMTTISTWRRKNRIPSYRLAAVLEQVPS
jgi:sRNA-binding protein